MSQWKDISQEGGVNCVPCFSKFLPPAKVLVGGGGGGGRRHLSFSNRFPRFFSPHPPTPRDKRDDRLGRSHDVRDFLMRD
jgi:hypothetical protein